MFKARQLATHAGDALRVDLSQRDTVALLDFSDHLTPRVDDHAVAVGAAPEAVVAVLSRCDHVALTLDGTRAQQHVPMCGTGCAGKRAGHGEGDRPLIDQRLVQGREAQVVAHRQAEATERQIRGHEGVARGRALRFVELGTVVELHVEQMNLAVQRANLALPVEMNAGVQRSGIRGVLLMKAAQYEVAPQLTCELAAAVKDRATFRERLQQSLFLRGAAEERECFRQEDGVSALFCCRAAQRFRLIEVAVDIVGGAQLHHGNGATGRAACS